LAFTEAVTLIAEGGVPDDVWDAVAAEFDETEIVHLLMKIGAINVYNRMNVAARTSLGPEPYVP
jgi:alkylhydroperoxidase family enzyme